MPWAITHCRAAINAHDPVGLRQPGRRRRWRRGWRRRADSKAPSAPERYHSDLPHADGARPCRGRTRSTTSALPATASTSVRFWWLRHPACVHASVLWARRGEARADSDRPHSTPRQPRRAYEFRRNRRRPARATRTNLDHRPASANRVGRDDDLRLLGRLDGQRRRDRLPVVPQREPGRHNDGQGLSTFSGLACGTSYSAAVAAFDLAGNTSAQASAIMTTAACPAADTTPPTVPGGISLGAVSQTSIALSWAASTDNVAVAGYGVYRNGALAGSRRGHEFHGRQSHVRDELHAFGGCGGCRREPVGEVVGFGFDERMLDIAAAAASSAAFGLGESVGRCERRLVCPLGEQGGILRCPGVLVEPGLPGRPDRRSDPRQGRQLRQRHDRPQQGLDRRTRRDLPNRFGRVRGRERLRERRTSPARPAAATSASSAR